MIEGMNAQRPSQNNKYRQRGVKYQMTGDNAYANGRKQILQKLNKINSNVFSTSTSKNFNPDRSKGDTVSSKSIRPGDV